MIRERITTCVALSLMMLASCGACDDGGRSDPSAGDETLLIRASGGSVVSPVLRPGRPWSVNYAVDLCLQQPGEAFLDSLDINGLPAQNFPFIESFLLVNPDAKDGGFLSLRGDVTELIRESGGETLPLKGSTVTYTCDDPKLRYQRLLMRVEVPAEGFTIDEFALHYKVDGRRERASSDFVFVACGTAQTNTDCK